MKTRSILLGAILMAAITPAFAQATAGTQGTKMNHDKQAMPMKDAADIQSAPVAMPLDSAGTRRPAT